MKNIAFAFLFATLLLQCTGSGQTADIPADDQTAKIDSIIEISKKRMNENSDSAKILLEQLLLSSKNDISKINEGKIYLLIGQIYSAKKEIEKSDSLYRKTIQILDNTNDPCLLSSAYMNLGINQSKKGNQLSAIEFYKKAEEMIENQANNCDNMQSPIYNGLGSSYEKIGKPDSAKYYLEKAFDYAKEKNDKQMMANALVNMCVLLHRYKEFEVVKNNLIQAIGLYEEVNNKMGLIGAYQNLGVAYIETKNYDSALSYLEKADSLSTLLNLPGRKTSIYHNMGRIYYENKNYKKSLEYENKSLEIKMEFNDSAGIAFSQNALSAIFTETGNYKEAKEMAEKAINYAQHTNNPVLLLSLYQTLSEVLIRSGEKGEALEALSKKEELQDSIFSKQKIEAVQEWQVKYETLQKETEIQLLKERQETQQKAILLYIIIIFLLIVAVILGIAWINNFRKKTKMQLEQLKYRTVKSKFMPHFIGNVLNSINYLIIKNPDIAQKYIADFSTFTNQSLFNADKFDRTLEEEITYAESYLELEKLRFEEKLKYEVSVAPGVDIQKRIPTMILHTFCENAIKHGLRPKPEGGRITIRVYSEADYVILSVEDDGIGRNKAQQLRTGGTKEGLKIVQQQLEIYNRKQIKPAYLQIIDLSDETGEPSGTRFELHMP
ncbi:MAG: tetratricopeptide repeat protein [Tannerella sp.]|jgi:tetratricopeptide (TPR) repeat protein|nr:tetratricopeptide repeat protein [Tannerella sp.]